MLTDITSFDGTGYFSSDKVHCQNCCEKHRGATTYYHVGSRCTRKEVFPFGEGRRKKERRGGAA